MKFTEKSLSKLALCTAGENGRMVFDDKTTGLAVYVSETSKTYYLYKSINGRKYKKSLKLEVGRDSLEQAREQVTILIGKLASGEDVIEQDRARRHASTINEIWTWYFENKVKGQKKAAHKYDEMYRRHIKASAIANRRIVDVTAQQLTLLYNKVKAATGVPTANRTRSILSIIFSAARDYYGFDKLSPVRLVKAEREHPSQRLLSDSEAEKIFKVLDADGDDWSDYFYLLALTGLRKTNAAALLWSEINLGEGYIAIPPEKMKSNRWHRLPIGPKVIEILSRRTLASQSEFVFPSKRSKAGYLVHPYEKWESILKRAGITEKTTPHHLRHYCASMMLRENTPLPIIQATLNHADIKTTTRYLHFELEQQRKYIEAANAKSLGKAT